MTMKATPAEAKPWLSEPVCVESYSTRQLADLAHGILESEGVRSTIVADDFGGLQPWLAAHGVRLFVAADDAERAREILAALMAE